MHARTYKFFDSVTQVFFLFRLLIESLSLSLLSLGSLIIQTAACVQGFNMLVYVINSYANISDCPSEEAVRGFHE